MKRPSGEFLAHAVGRYLGEERSEKLAAVGADVVIPVPMHWTRRLQRGTNSADILAGCLRAKLGVPVWRRRVVRRRKTLPQADLKPRERFRNVRGAFSVRRARAFQGRRILLVDDILTTGATCSEISGVLKKAGAELVSAVVVARAQGTKGT